MAAPDELLRNAQTETGILLPPKKLSKNFTGLPLLSPFIVLPHVNGGNVVGKSFSYFVSWLLKCSRTMLCSSEPKRLSHTAVPTHAHYASYPCFQSAKCCYGSSFILQWVLIYPTMPYDNYVVPKLSCTTVTAYTGLFNETKQLYVGKVKIK